MDNKAKASIIFVILLLLVSLGAAGFYFISYKNEKKERVNLEKQLKFEKGEKLKIQKQLDEINKEKAALEEKVRENENLISGLNDKLAEVLQTKELLTQEKETLGNEAIRLKQEKEAVDNALNNKLKELSQLQERLDAVVSEKSELEKKMAESSSVKPVSEQLEKIVVSNQDAPKEEVQKPALSANVLLINKEYSFLVLNVGNQSGVEAGNIFEVFKEDKSLGSVQVEKVHDSMSAANFLEGFKRDEVSEGDSAKRINYSPSP